MARLEPLPSDVIRSLLPRLPQTHLRKCAAVSRLFRECSATAELWATVKVAQHRDADPPQLISLLTTYGQNITELNLRGCRSAGWRDSITTESWNFTTEAVAMVCPGLKTLDLSASGVGDQGLELFAKNCACLETVRLFMNEQVSSEGLAALLRHRHAELRSLDLRGCGFNIKERVDNASLDLWIELSKCQKLKVLNLKGAYCVGDLEGLGSLWQSGGLSGLEESDATPSSSPTTEL